MSKVRGWGAREGSDGERGTGGHVMLGLEGTVLALAFTLRRWETTGGF